MRKALLFAVIILMTLSCNKTTTEPDEVPFSVLGEITSINTTHMMMKTDQDLNVTFALNGYATMLKTGSRIYAIGSLHSPTDDSYNATLYGLSVVSINKTYLYKDIKDDEDLRNKLGHNDLNIVQGGVGGKYLTIFTESKSDHLSLVITNTNISNGAINIDAELCNNTLATGGAVITSFDISEYMKYASGTINLKFKSGNSSVNEHTFTWDKK